MPLTAEQAAKQIAAEIKASGKGWKPGNIFDAVIGFGANNTDALQEMLNDLLKKKGVLTPQDETAIQELLAAQEAARRKTKKIRTRNTIIFSTIGLTIGVIVYFIVKKKKS